MAVTTFNVGGLSINSHLLARLATDKGWKLSLMGDAIEESGETAGLPRDWSTIEIFDHQREFLGNSLAEWIADFAKPTIIASMQEQALEKQQEIDNELSKRKIEITETLKEVEKQASASVNKSVTVKTTKGEK